MNARPIKVAVVMQHPVQYHVGIMRALSAHQELDATVLYLDDFGLHPFFEPEFGREIRWDVDLLSGYKYAFLRNLAINKFSGFFSRVNPGIVIELLSNQYEVVLLQSYAIFSYALAWMLAKLTGKKIIFRGEATLTGTEKSTAWTQLAKRKFLPFFFMTCDAVMYSCSGNRQYFKYYSVPDYKLFPIPCAVDNEYFQKMRAATLPHRATIRAKMGIKDNDLVVIFSAKFNQNKRPLDLIDAVSRVDNGSIFLLFVGDGALKAEMERTVNQKGLRAFFTGFVNSSQISNCYLASDVFVNISGYDYSPKSMNEAMNFALPIICTNRAGTAYDLVHEGRNGFLVNTGDISAIAAKLEYLNLNRDAARRMGEESLKIVEGWTFEADADSISKTVKHVLGVTKAAENNCAQVN